MLLVGIDVGGTNTDGILLNPSKLSEDNKGVVSYHKSVTTQDVSKGIENVVGKLFDKVKDYSKKDVLSFTIGTTHFINAVVEQDKARLEKVAVFRLCGPYSKGIPPFSNFPQGLTDIVSCYNAFIDGGFRVDGVSIKELDEDAILEHATKVKELGINSVAINGIYSAINHSHEIRAAELIRSVLPNANIVMSHEVSGIGFLARENAAILNASIMSFAAKILKSFVKSVKMLEFDCPILLTQNDGTVLTIQEAMKTPIKTFSSGATNSMRGAAFLCSNDEEVVGKNVMVVDIGGTTADVGLLLPNGFPRQVSSHSIIGGVRMNFSMPHVESIGLGGGSIVREQVDGEITIGPDSVGAEITTKALVFGGDVTTTTDVVLALQGDNEGKFASISKKEMMKLMFTDDFYNSYSKTISKKLSDVIDRMRTNPDPLPVLLVGGGSFIAPLEIEGASKVMRPPYYDVANAIGAALGKLSFVLQRVEKLDSIGEKDRVIEDMTREATRALVEKGGLEPSVSVVDVAYDVIPYIEKTYTFEVKLVADVDYDRIAIAFKKFSNGVGDSGETESVIKDTNVKEKKLEDEQDTINHSNYKPYINDKREWIISPTDLDYISIGAYILGCGGGGSPYAVYLELMNYLKNGDTIKVIDMKDLPEDGRFIPVALAGSPTVSVEQLSGDELLDACKASFDYFKSEATGIFSTEIGGGNGLRAMLCGTSSKLNIPVVDCDLMGRAYPTISQVKPCIFHDELFLNFSAGSDGNGNQFLVTKAQSDIYVEKIMRAALAEVGSHIGLAHNMFSYTDMQNFTVHNSISNSWRIGKAVRKSRQDLQIDQLPTNILNSLGGSTIGKELFLGKIISVEKKLFKGHVYGEVILENQEGDKLLIPFKNENLVAKLNKKGTAEWLIICSVPDLISVCYADTGEAIGTQDYRYGVIAFVLGFAPDSSWTTERGLKVGGPASFGPAFDGITYEPVGKSVLPQSVIEEYSSI